MAILTKLVILAPSLVFITHAQTVEQCATIDCVPTNTSGVITWSLTPGCQAVCLGGGNPTTGVNETAGEQCPEIQNECVLNTCDPQFATCCTATPCPQCAAPAQSCTSNCDYQACLCFRSALCIPGSSTTIFMTTTTSTPTTTTASTSTAATQTCATGLPDLSDEPCVNEIYQQCRDLGGLVQNGLPVDVNGCGPASAPLLTEILGVLVPEFTTCCDAHDQAYAQCQTAPLAKEQADSALGSCMNNMCNAELTKLQSGCGNNVICNNYAEHLLLTCKVSAMTIYQAVSRAGCQAYNDAQAEFCKCACATSE